MRSWGRISDGVIVEIIKTDRPIDALYHPDLHWADLSECGSVAVGWQWDGAQAKGPEKLAEAGVIPALNV